MYMYCACTCKLADLDVYTCTCAFPHSSKKRVMESSLVVTLQQILRTSLDRQPITPMTPTKTTALHLQYTDTPLHPVTPGPVHEQAAPLSH